MHIRQMHSYLPMPPIGHWSLTPHYVFAIPSPVKYFGWQYPFHDQSVICLLSKSKILSTMAMYGAAVQFLWQ